MLSVLTVVVIKYADYSQKDDVLSLRLSNELVKIGINPEAVK